MPKTSAGLKAPTGMGKCRGRRIAQAVLDRAWPWVQQVPSEEVYTPRSAPYDLPLTLPWSDSDEDFQTASEESPAPSQWLAPALDPGGLLPPWNAQRFRFWKVHMMAARSGGQVELHLDLMTGGTVAVKHVPRSRLRESPQAYQEAWPGEVENPWKEIEILSRFGLGPDQLPGVCRSFGSFRTECGDGMLVCEYLPGGDLFDIAAKLGEPGPEREQQIYPIFYSLVQAVRALHLRGIAHGDLSLENALLRGSQVVLIDFAMAVTDHVDHATGHRGKPSYMAPEMFSQRSYDARAADVFSCGVCAYALAMGSYPWSSTRPNACLAFMFAQRFGVAELLQRRRIVTSSQRVPIASAMSPVFRQNLEAMLCMEAPRRPKFHHLGCEMLQKQSAGY